MNGKRFAAIIILLAGIACIGIGFYYAVFPLITLGIDSIGSGIGSAVEWFSSLGWGGGVLSYALVLVAMWTGIYFLGKSLVRSFPDLNYSTTGKFLGGLIYTVAIFTTLVIIGAIILHIARYEQHMDKLVQPPAVRR